MLTYLQQMIQVQRKENDGMVRADGPKGNQCDRSKSK